MSSVRRRLLAAVAAASQSKPVPGVNIGDSFMGGYYAGIIDTTEGNIIAGDASQTGLRYALIVAPKSLESSGLQYKASEDAAPAAARTRWDGLSATTAMNNFLYVAAQFCLTQTAPSDTASSWYLPAIDELELIYRNLKASTENNYTSSTGGGSFPGGTLIQGYSPSSDPAGAAYSSSVPAQTAVTAFKTGGTEALGLAGSDYSYWSSTEYGTFSAWFQSQSGASSSGRQRAESKLVSFRVRPVRRLVL